ncbi:hypothetical protein CVS40_5151 [Lucilia cuprina]|nr:hypothetical protein CVS40_5151 [Lucilia cuprina]
MPDLFPKNFHSAPLCDGRHDEETEIDLVYGLLNIKYRKHIARQDFKTFRELLEKGRVIEHNMLEAEGSHQDKRRQRH